METSRVTLQNMSIILATQTVSCILYQLMISFMLACLQLNLSGVALSSHLITNGTKSLMGNVLHVIVGIRHAEDQ
jgi:hypothetical protein